MSLLEYQGDIDKIIFGQDGIDWTLGCYWFIYFNGFDNTNQIKCY